MTVIVMIKHKDEYHIIGDGRTSRGWMGIATNNTTKVREGKGCIYGTCGKAAAKLIIADVLNKTSNPMQVLRKLKSKDYKDILQSSTTIVASKLHGCYTIEIHEKFGSGHDVDILTWDEDALPQAIGSGSLSVEALLSLESKVTPSAVKKAIQQSYTVNHTIGGKISHVSLKLPKRRGKR